METGNSVLVKGVQQDLRAHIVRGLEVRRLLNGPVHMALSCKVYDDIKLLRAHEAADALGVGDVALDEAKIRVLAEDNRTKTAETAGVGQVVIADDLSVIVLAEHVENKVAPYESGTAGD